MRHCHLSKRYKVKGAAAAALQVACDQTVQIDHVGILNPRVMDAVPEAIAIVVCAQLSHAPDRLLRLDSLLFVLIVFVAKRAPNEATREALSMLPIHRVARWQRLVAQRIFDISDRRDRQNSTFWAGCLLLSLFLCRLLLSASRLLSEHRALPIALVALVIPCLARLVCTLGYTNCSAKRADTAAQLIESSLHRTAVDLAADERVQGLQQPTLLVLERLRIMFPNGGEINITTHRVMPIGRGQQALIKVSLVPP